MTDNGKYKLAYSKGAIKDLAKLDKGVRAYLKTFLDDEIDKMSNPRSKGKPLKGDYDKAWRYRKGSYRVICHIDDDKMVVLAVKIGHRKDIYN